MMRSTNSSRETLREQLNAAITCNRRGDASRAIRMLKNIINDNPRSGAAHGYLGGIYFEKSKFDEAETFFRQATLLSQKSELASVGLFHSLWSQGRRREAFAEMRRYLKDHDSKEYSTLLRDFVVSGQFEPELDEISA